MRLTLCSLITRRSSISIISYSISIKFTFALIFCMGILLTTFIPSVMCWQMSEIEKICSCGLQVPQQQFCQHDFVFAGKRVNRVIKKFNQRNSNKITKLLPYKGDIYRIRVLYNFKGIFVNYERNKVFINVYVFRSFSCGIPYNVELKRHRVFIFSGYRYQNMLIINSCTWLQPLNEISQVQTIGLFQGHYQNYCHIKDRCQISFYYKSMAPADNNCQIKTTYKECYEKYSICQLNLSNQCGFHTNYTSLTSSKQTTDNIPKLLKVKYQRPPLFDKFMFCIRLKYINQRP